MTQKLFLTFPSSLFVILVPLCFRHCLRAGLSYRNSFVFNIFTVRNYFQHFIFISLACQLLFNFWLICLCQRQSKPQLLRLEASEHRKICSPLSFLTLFATYLSSFLTISAFTLRFVFIAKYTSERFRFRLARLSHSHSHSCSYSRSLSRRTRSHSRCCSSVNILRLRLCLRRNLIPFFIFIFIPVLKLGVVVVAVVLLFK